MCVAGFRLSLCAALAATLWAWSAPRVSADSTNQLFVERAYHDLLGRVPGESDLDSFAGALDHGLATNQDVAATITGSVEFQGGEVQQQYQKLLHRTADSLSLNGWVGAFRSGTTVEQLESNLASSPEYYTNRGGGTNDGFLTALYPDLLGRSISFSERAVDDAALSGGESRTNLVSSLVSGTEYDQHVVNGWYPQFLHRAADTFGRNYYVNEMQAGQRDEQVISQLIGSPEYSRLPFLAGDVNFDQTVGFDDLLTLAQNYGLAGAHWFNGDFSGNGTVDFGDLLALAQNYGRAAAIVPATLAPVPDPLVVPFAIVGSLLCRARRETRWAFVVTGGRTAAIPRFLPELKRRLGRASGAGCL